MVGCRKIWVNDQKEIYQEPGRGSKGDSEVLGLDDCRKDNTVNQKGKSGTLRDKWVQSPRQHA